MTDPFPGFLLESRVIVDKRWKCVTDLRFIDRPLFIDLLTLHDEIFCEKICSKRCWRSRANCPLRACRFRQELLAKQGCTLWCYTASFAWFGSLFQTLQTKRTWLINIHIERVPATLKLSREFRVRSRRSTLDSLPNHIAMWIGSMRIGFDAIQFANYHSQCERYQCASNAHSIR